MQYCSIPVFISNFPIAFTYIESIRKILKMSLNFKEAFGILLMEYKLILNKMKPNKIRIKVNRISLLLKLILIRELITFSCIKMYYCFNTLEERQLYFLKNQAMKLVVSKKNNDLIFLNSTILKIKWLFLSFMTAIFILTTSKIKGQKWLISKMAS